MTPEITPEITGLLAAAAAKLHAADLLLRAGLQGDAVSRAYYAVFHAISALHLSRGNTFSSHAQLIGRFNKDFVRSGVFPPEFTRILARLFEDRQVADYDAIIVIRGDEATQDLTDARRIVETIRTHLTETSTGDIASGSPGA